MFSRDKGTEASQSPDVPRLHSRWYEAHSVAGVFALIPLFVILVTGTISFFRAELRAWHTPALRVEVAEPLAKVDAILSEHLDEVPAEADHLRIDFPTEWSPLVSMQWQNEGEEKRIKRAYHPVEGTEVDSNAISSEWAMHIYRWHYLRPIPGGLQISGFIALAWFALTVSGFYIHRKELLSQFKGWGKRKGKALQSWLHGITATLTLPFHLIFGVTGAIFGLNLVALPLVLFLGYKGDQEELMQYFSGVESPAEFTETRVESLPPLDPFIERTLEEAPGVEIVNLFLEKPYDEGARLHVHFDEGGGAIGEAKFDIHESTEPVFFATASAAPIGSRIMGVAFMLHFANFGGLFMKILYTIGGVLLCLLTYAGARLWILSKAKQLPRGSVFFERFFDGFAVGLFPAIAIFAWANRLLPASIPDRAGTEILVFHVAWAAIALLLVVFGTSRQRRRTMMIATVVLLALVPVLDGILYQAWPWDATSWYVPSVGVTNLFLILSALTWGGWSLLRRAGHSTSQSPVSSEPEKPLASSPRG
ncbi:MAG: PepSY-associated TM helix domain-containing protein [Verrucomicrobiota bacterium]